MAKVNECVVTEVGMQFADRCANINCPNKPGEGQFCFVQIGNMRLFMCASCSKALTAALMTQGS